MWCRHTYSGRLLSLRKGILTLAATWMKPEDIMLSEKKDTVTKKTSTVQFDRCREQSNSC